MARRVCRLGVALLVVVVVVALDAVGEPLALPGQMRDQVRDPIRGPITPGPRAAWLLDQLAPGPLRERLEACRDRPARATRFAIGHRGAPLQLPEHTRESYVAAARMGAGVVECDVTFTQDRVLVCRHSQCDLATTTNILETPLAARCAVPFTPARLDPESDAVLEPATARCCTSALRVDEFLSLEGRMDASNPRARTVAEFLDATPAWRTDLYDSRGTLLTHDESIALFRRLGVGMTPELKAPEVPMPFDGDFTRDAYAAALVDAYRRAGVPPEDVAMQSFDADDVRRWLRIAPEYGRRAIWLDGRDPRLPTPPVSLFESLHAEGFRTVAPRLSLLLALDGEGRIRATDYARHARAAGLDLVAWTLERSGRIRDGRVEGRAADYYVGPILPALRNDGDLYRVIEALHREAGVRAIFSDWPAAVVAYANCLGLP